MSNLTILTLSKVMLQHSLGVGGLINCKISLQNIYIYFGGGEGVLSQSGISSRGRRRVQKGEDTMVIYILKFFFFCNQNRCPKWICVYCFYKYPQMHTKKNSKLAYLYPMFVQQCWNNWKPYLTIACVR